MDIANLKLGRVDPERLISRPEWGALNFEEIRPELAMLRSIVEQIQSIDADAVPKSIYNQLQQRREEIEGQLQAVGKFSIAADNPKALHTEITKAVIFVCSSWR
jgi:hypothetical protein